MKVDFQTLLHRAQRQLNEGAAEAAETARQLAERFPKSPETWLVLGVLARREGRLAEAEQGFRMLAELAPGHPEPWRQIGLTRLAAQDRDGAERAFRQGLAAAPTDPGLLCHLGQVLRETGRLSEAEDRFRQADIPPGWLGLAECLRERGRPDLIAEPCERALAADPALAPAALRLAQVRLMAGRFADAEAAAAAIALPGPAAAVALRHARRGQVPAWHFPMMNDAARNEPYRDALRRAAKTRGGRLLEIGTGAGLLALLGAEAGFAEVITCEADPLIAAAAREVVAANGLSDRITVIAKRSTELQIGVDLPGPADVLVTETFGSALLSEGVLPSLDHARRFLLAPDALIVPRAGSIVCALVGGDSLARQFAVGRVMGFDLSPFERFRMVKVTGNLDLYGESELLSEAAEVFRFDFQDTAWHPPATRALTLTATRAGLCQGVAQWIRLDLDDQAGYENRPGRTGGDSGWTHYLHFFPRPRWIEAGEVIRLEAEHDRLSVDIVEAAP